MSQALAADAAVAPGDATQASAAPCPYSIGRRLSLLLAVQTIIGLGVLLAVIYGVTAMLFTSRQDEELRAYSAVLVEVLISWLRRTRCGATRSSAPAC